MLSFFVVDARLPIWNKLLFLIDLCSLHCNCRYSSNEWPSSPLLLEVSIVSSVFQVISPRTPTPSSPLFLFAFFLFFHRFIVTDKILTISCDSVHILHTLTHRQKRKMNDGAGYNCRVWSTCPKSRARFDHVVLLLHFCCPEPIWAPLRHRDTKRGWRAT